MLRGGGRRRLWAGCGGGGGGKAGGVKWLKRRAVGALGGERGIAGRRVNVCLY